eukprot:g414.t1 g414   contig1:1000515-1000940(+)
MTRQFTTLIFSLDAPFGLPGSVPNRSQRDGWVVGFASSLHMMIIPTENVRFKLSSLCSQLALLGIPLSVFTLVKNLLDCHEGDFVGDEAYKSFEDVRADLQLMLDDPSRFLDNIRPTSHPSFCIGDKLYGRDDDVADVKEA